MDNMGIFSLSSDVVRAGLEEAKEHFTRLGLFTHDLDVFEGSCEILGCLLECEEGVTRPTPKRLQTVFRALSYLLQKRRCNGFAKQNTVLGHCAFLALVMRPLLCVFSASNRYVENECDHCGTMWGSALDELRYIQELPCYATSGWSLDWN